MSCVFFWLQIFTAFLAAILGTQAQTWLKGWMDKGSNDGIWECADNVECWRPQAIARVEAAGMLVFFFLLLVVPCASVEHALKFIAVPTVTTMLLFVANSWISVFIDVASILTGMFLSVQALLLINFGYCWAESWHGNLIAAQDNDESSPSIYCWLISIVFFSIVLSISSITAGVSLWVEFPEGYALIVPTVLVSIFLIFASGSGYFKNSGLLPAGVATSYTMWLTYEAMAFMPNEGSWPIWPGLIIALGTLVNVIRNSVTAAAHEENDKEKPLVDSADGEATSTRKTDGVKAQHIVLQCGIHILGTAYVCAELGSQPSSLAYGARSFAVVMSMLLYGWTLMAPKVLVNRDFD